MRINILIIQYSAPSAWLSVRLCKWACPKITSGQTNLPLRRITAVDGWFNVIRQVTATCPLMRAHWRHLVNTIELVYPSAHSSPHPKQQMDRFSRFWATVCKTVRPMLSDRRPVCLSVCLSVTLVYCGQTVGRIKMKLGMQVSLGPGHIVLDGDPAPPPPKGHSPLIFGPFILWPNGWMHQDAI